MSRELVDGVGGDGMGSGHHRRATAGHERRCPWASTGRISEFTRRSRLASSAVGAGVEQVLRELSLGGNELVGDLALSLEQLLKGVVG